MLVAKGSSVWMKLDDGREVLTRGAMLHDESGHSWPKNSLLFASFKRLGTPATDAQAKGAPRNYLGRGYSVSVGRVELPPKVLSAWTEVGPVKRVEYVRGGSKAPGGFYHNFGERRLAGLFRSGKHPVLYKHKSMYRLELGSNSIADDRGLVFP